MNAMKLQSADEMVKVAESNYAKLKEAALKSSDYQTIVKGIDKQANRGLREYTYYNNANKEMVNMFKSILQEHGYTVTSHVSKMGIVIRW